MAKAVLIQGATILTLAGDEPFTGDILSEDGRISAIAPMLPADGAYIVEASGLIAIPGLVNAHIHLWQGGLRGVAGDWSFSEYFEKMLAGIAGAIRPEELAIGNEIGAWEQIEAGVTTLFDWSHALGGPDHADAALAGLEASGIRAIFGYGPPSDPLKWWSNSTERHPTDAARLAKRLQGHDRIRLALAIRGPDFTPDRIVAHDIRAARDLGILASMHIGVRPGRRSPHEGLAGIARAGLLGPDLNFVHANTLSDEEHGIIADAGASVSLAPEIELQQGMGLPATGAVLRAGGLPSIGTDVTAAYSPDMFGQMRLILQLQRHADWESLRQGDERKFLTSRDVLLMATIGGAKALRLDNEIGTLEVGKRADIVLVRPGFAAGLSPVADPYQAIVLHSGAGNVVSVIIDGKIRKENYALIDPPGPKQTAQIRASATRLAGLIAS